MSDAMPQSLRADAQKNRDRVLEAARGLFAESGLEVTMRQVARRAGVGPATLYRRFPTKQDLVLEAMRDEFAACAGIVHDAAADSDPWHGFRTAIERLLVLNARNQGFTAAFLSAYPDAFDVTSHRLEMARELTHLARRAIAAGELREDFVLDDLLLVLLAGRGLATTPPSKRDAAARRLAAVMADGFHADGAKSQLPSPSRLTSFSG